MRKPPSNRNVPQWMWDHALEEHTRYLDRYTPLRERQSLNDQDADRYIELADRLQCLAEILHDTEVDFHSDNHNPHFDEANTVLAEMRAILLRGKG